MFGDPPGLESSALTWARTHTHRHLAAPPPCIAQPGSLPLAPQRDRCPGDSVAPGQLTGTGRDRRFQEEELLWVSSHSPERWAEAQPGLPTGL